MTFVFHIVPRGKNHSLNGLSITYFSLCCDKTVGNGQLRKEELISAHGQGTILYNREVLLQEAESNGC